MKKLISLLCALILTINLASAAVENQYNCQQSRMMSGLFGGDGITVMLLSWIIYILFIVLIIAAIYWLFNSTKKDK